VSETVILLLHAGVGHTGHSRPLLRQTQEVGPSAVGATAGRFDRLRTAVVGTPVPETLFNDDASDNFLI
jgi:hypothetical protein